MTIKGIVNDVRKKETKKGTKTYTNTTVVIEGLLLSLGFGVEVPETKKRIEAEIVTLWHKGSKADQKAWASHQITGWIEA